MSSQHPRETGGLEQERQKEAGSPAGNVREEEEEEEEAARGLTENTSSSPAPQGSQTGDNQSKLERPHPAPGPMDGRHNAISGPNGQPRPGDVATQAQGDNNDINRRGSSIGGHPNPLGSNPVVMTEHLARILARENSPPPPPPTPTPSPLPPRP
ncbi:hypothetical protein PG991_009898 [Apiospora marii]|uniref:Uncharacterized protein n=1 Tax=Apiospora marii TaxID=335849 RepID=A0ABR1RH95_9PEZI